MKGVDLEDEERGVEDGDEGEVEDVVLGEAELGVDGELGDELVGV
jgi:hypothetical protein